MSSSDKSLRQLFQKEANDSLFINMDLSESVKQTIRDKAALEKPVRRRLVPRSWITAAAAVAAAIAIILGIPVLQQPAGNDPVGSELSQLTTISLNSEEEAKEAFGHGLQIPVNVPEGFTLKELAAVGFEGEPARDVIFTYASGEKSFTFVASRNPAVFPAELFTPIQINGAGGFVFEQPELIELFWMEENIQYSITGQLSAEEALSAAESVQS